MVVQLDIKGDLEKMIIELIEKKYSHLSKKSFLVEMIRKQVEEEMK